MGSVAPSPAPTLPACEVRARGTGCDPCSHRFGFPSAAVSGTGDSVSAPELAGATLSRRSCAELGCWEGCSKDKD